MKRNEDNDFIWAVIKVLSFLILMWGVIPVLFGYLIHYKIVDPNLGVFFSAGSFFISLPILLLFIHYDNKKEDKKEEEEYFKMLDSDPI